MKTITLCGKRERGKKRKMAADGNPKKTKKILRKLLKGRLGLCHYSENRTRHVRCRLL